MVFSNIWNLRNQKLPACHNIKFRIVTSPKTKATRQPLNIAKLGNMLGTLPELVHFAEKLRVNS